jgi:hypothetical protein
LKKPYIFFQCKMCFCSKSLNTESDKGIFSDGFFFFFLGEIIRISKKVILREVSVARLQMSSNVT